MIVPSWRQAVLALAALCCAAGPAAAEPALWCVKGDKAVIYLFGTVHALKADTKWRSPKIDAAFKKSSELWLEVDEDIADPAKAMLMIRDLGLDWSHPLYTHLSKNDMALLDANARTAGINDGEDTLDFFRPWAASMMLDGAAFKKAGYDTKDGVEVTLMTEAKAAKKPIKGMEGFGQHFHFLADLPPKVELEMLKETVHDLENAPKRVGEVIEAWTQGDVDAIAKSNAEMKDSSPELYQTILVQRNQNWAVKIADMMKEPQTRFIAVGAGHLAGPDSLLVQLQSAGITAERL